MAAVTIYWYGPERPASRRCLVRCAALFAGEPLAGAEERWPVQESEKGKPFFPLSPETHCSVTHSGDYWLDYTLCVCAKEISSVQLVPGK